MLRPCLIPCFQCVACGLRIALPLAPATAMAAMQRIATTETWAKHTTDDLEDREISAAGIHGFYPKREYEGGAGRGAEGAFRYGLPKHHSRLARDKVGGSRRGEVPKELREGRDEA